MNTLESKLRIAHQIQVAAIKKDMRVSVYSAKENFSIDIHHDDEHVESLWDWDVSEQELLDWWEEIAK